MSTENVDAIVHAYDAQGKPLGVFIPYAIWKQLDDKIKEALVPPTSKITALKEPLADWDMLVSCWDFPYPVDMDVHCSTCSNMTENWQQDQPRKFQLKAANLGGLVAFECCACKSRIRKNHFKDTIDVACTPVHKT